MSSKIFFCFFVFLFLSFPVFASVSIYNSTLSIPKCANISSAFLLLSPSDIVVDVDLDSGFTSSMREINGDSRAAQFKHIYNNSIDKLGFSQIYKTGSPTGSLYFRIRNFTTDEIIDEKFWGDVSSLTTSPSYIEVDFNSSEPLIDGDVWLSFEVDNLVGEYVQVSVSENDAVISEYYRRYRGSSWIEWGTSEWNLRDMFYNITFVHDIFPYNLSVNLSSFLIFNQTGYFSVSDSTPDFSSELQAEISSCNSSEYSYCEIPLFFFSNVSSQISYSSNISFPSCLGGTGGVTEPVFENVGGFVRDWNPEVYPEISPSFESLFIFSDFKELPKNFINFIGVVFRFIFKQPGSLVDVTEVVE